VDEKEPIDMTDEEYAKFIMSLSSPSDEEPTRSGALAGGRIYPDPEED